MNRFFILGLLVLVITVSGCVASDIGKNQIYIKDSQVSSEFVQPNGETFKVFFTLRNPTKTIVQPYIMAKYDSNLLVLNSFGFDRPKEVQSVLPQDENSYFLEFRTQILDKPQAGQTTKIDILLVGAPTDSNALETATVEVKIANRVG